MMERQDKNRLLASLPPEWPHDLLLEIQRRVRGGGRKVVVLEDDPTGTQTVHNLPVLTHWPMPALRLELENNLPAFYLLTNSRSLPPAGAADLNAEIGHNLLRAGQLSHRDFAVVSRSDSTLRGHFPGEVQALASALARNFDGWLLVPAFLEGGRYTIDDIHYVAEGEVLVPAGQTEFARDAALGYRASNLRQWVAEKTEGRVRANEVASISIADLRQGGPERVTDTLLALHDGRVCIVNAASYRDLQVLVAGLLAAELQGRRYLYRTAASFVQVRAGLPARPPLASRDLSLAGPGGGLVVVGSFVPRTTRQVEVLLERGQVESIQVNVDRLLGLDRPDEIRRAAAAADQALSRGEDVVVYTGREPKVGEDAESSLQIGRQVSEGLVEIVCAIPTRPRYLLAKGGITSSDIATRGLEVKRAMVRGQLLPGVPVWELGPESRFPGLPYIVFPGNVGGPTALAEIVDRLRD